MFGEVFGVVLNKEVFSKECRIEQIIGAKAETAAFMARDLSLFTLPPASLNSIVGHLATNNGQTFG